MPSKITISEVKNSNSQITTETAPKTAVFIGATAGIGKATLIRLVAQQTAIKIYVVGRNAAKQQDFIEQLQKSNKKAIIVFLEGEVSLMAEVKRICAEIKAKESSIDAVFLSTGYIAHGGREKTNEGIDLFSALAYYGRLLFVLHLLPLLKTSSNNPRIVNLGGASNEVSNLNFDDLDLEKPGNYTMWNMINYVATAMTLTLSRVANENPDIDFIFNLPGLVPTEIHAGSMFDKWYGRWLFSLAGVSIEDSGERSVFLLTSARFGGKGVPLQSGATKVLTMKKTESGALFCVNSKLEGVQQEKVMAKLESQDAGNRVWARLQEVLAPYL